MYQKVEVGAYSEVLCFRFIFGKSVNQQSNVIK